MLASTLIILPAARAHWDVWKSGRGGEATWRGPAESPSQGANGSGESVVIGLPARSCRTFGFVVPTEDPKLFRQLAFAQLERRGLAAGPAEETAFNCHVHRKAEGRSVLSVDVVLPDGAALTLPSRTHGLVPSSRLFPLPNGRLVIMEEQGRLILCAGDNGQVVHSQVIAGSGGLTANVGQELRVASLTLPQQGLMPEVTGVDVWGDFPAEEVAALGHLLDLPVEARPRPAPVLRPDVRRASATLLPAPIRQQARARRRRPLGWMVAAAGAAALLAVAWRQNAQLRALEAEAARLEVQVNATSDESGRIEGEQSRLKETQARWSALRPAVETRRYPLRQLNAVARCLDASSAVLTRFESKPDAVSVSGTARSAGDAYAFYNAVRAEPELGLHQWSMVQPNLDADGTATFVITGKPK
ncbi:MAG: hypothetical protein ACKV19_10330 [Verrucomicrobiales bacterium]